MATMNICLSHDAAFRWLVRNRNPRITGNRTTARVLPCTSPFVSESKTLRSLLGIEAGKLEVLVRTSAGRRDGDCLRSHYSGSVYPAGSFVKVPVEGFGAVCCSSPELTFFADCGQTYLVGNGVYGLCALLVVSDRCRC